MRVLMAPTELGVGLAGADVDPLALIRVAEGDLDDDSLP